MDHHEAEQFRRITIWPEIERARGLIAQYREGIDYWRKQLDTHHQLLGRIAERLGEPEPEGRRG